MQINQLSLEIEFALLIIACKYHPHTRFKITPKIEPDWTQINFAAYFAESWSKKRPYSDPSHLFYRRDTFDLQVFFTPNIPSLYLSGVWREENIVLEYNNNHYSWSCQGQIIPRPHPDGDMFEAIASEMYPLLIKNGSNFNL